MTFDALLSQALKLPPERRERLALRLSMAQPEGDDLPLSPAHAAALRGRIEQYEADPDAVVPADESLRQARQHLEAHRRRSASDSKSA